MHGVLNPKRYMQKPESFIYQDLGAFGYWKVPLQRQLEGALQHFNFSCASRERALEVVKAMLAGYPDPSACGVCFYLQGWRLRRDESPGKPSHTGSVGTLIRFL